jgi:hypothetical protein
MHRLDGACVSFVEWHVSGESVCEIGKQIPTASAWFKRRKSMKSGKKIIRKLKKSLKKTKKLGTIKPLSYRTAP